MKDLKCEIQAACPSWCYQSNVALNGLCAAGLQGQGQCKATWATCQSTARASLQPSLYTPAVRPDMQTLASQIGVRARATSSISIPTNGHRVSLESFLLVLSPCRGHGEALGRHNTRVVDDTDAAKVPRWLYLAAPKFERHVIDKQVKIKLPGSSYDCISAYSRPVLSLNEGQDVGAFLCIRWLGVHN